MENLLNQTQKISITFLVKRMLVLETIDINSDTFMIIIHGNKLIIVFVDVYVHDSIEFISHLSIEDIFIVFIIMIIIIFIFFKVMIQEIIILIFFTF